MRTHFRRVLRILRAADVTGLAPAQRTNRAETIAALEAYARRGRFPRNRDFPGRMVPYFIDATGTRCGVACLVEASGDVALATRIALTRNNALVRELVDEPALVEWAARRGLTLEEVELIQPSYCEGVTLADYCVCSWTGVARGEVAAVAAGTLMAGTGDMAQMLVEEIHGDVPKDANGAPLIEVGDVFVSSYGLVEAVGDGVLAPISPTGTPAGPFLTLVGEEVVACQERVAKSDAIRALLLPGPGEEQGPESACSKALVEVDSDWGDESCGYLGGCGCSLTSTPDPGAYGAIALGFLAWMRRRRRRSSVARALRTERRARTP